MVILFVRLVKVERAISIRVALDVVIILFVKLMKKRDKKKYWGSSREVMYHVCLFVFFLKVARVLDSLCFCSLGSFFLAAS